MLLLMLLLVLLYGKLRGGTINNFYKEVNKLKNLKIMFIAGLIFIFFIKNPVTSLEFSLNYHVYLYSLFTVLILIFYCRNVNNKSILVICVGHILNTIVIVINGFKMPVSKSALLKAGMDNYLIKLESNLDPLYQLMTDQTKLWFLSDIFNIPVAIFLGFGGIFSIGDLIQAIGLFIFISQSMTKKA